MRDLRTHLDIGANIAVGCGGAAAQLDAVALAVLVHLGVRRRLEDRRLADHHLGGLGGVAVLVGGSASIAASIRRGNGIELEDSAVDLNGVREWSIVVGGPVDVLLPGILHLAVDIQMATDLHTARYRRIEHNLGQGQVHQLPHHKRFNLAVAIESVAAVLAQILRLDEVDS